MANLDSERKLPSATLKAFQELGSRLKKSLYPLSRLCATKKKRTYVLTCDLPFLTLKKLFWALCSEYWLYCKRHHFSYQTVNEYGMCVNEDKIHTHVCKLFSTAYFITFVKFHTVRGLCAKRNLMQESEKHIVTKFWLRRCHTARRKKWKTAINFYSRCLANRMIHTLHDVPLKVKVAR